MKRTLSIVVILLICMSIIIPANAGTFSLNTHKLTLFKGDKTTLEIEGVDSSRVTWRTSNKAVVKLQ